MLIRSLRNITVLSILGVAIFFGGCKKSPIEVNEEELITTVILTFSATGSTNSTQVIFRDLDGEGGNAPSQFDPILLDAGTIYNVGIRLLDESQNNPEDITLEVRAEGEDHQFYYIPSGVAITVGNLDTDSNGNPLGISSQWTTAGAGAGTVRVVLKHKPGSKGANDPVTFGDTDVDLSFQATIVP